MAVFLIHFDLCIFPVFQIHFWPWKYRYFLKCRKRFGEGFSDEKLVVASASHPAFKLMWIKDPEKKQDVKRLLVEEVKKELLLDTMNVSAESTGSQESDSNFFEFRDTSRQGRKSADELVDTFLRSGRSLDVLKSQDVLERVFRKFNTTLPSSAPVERLFSKAGGVLRKKQTFSQG